MKRTFLICLFVLSGAILARGQVTITSADMFNQVGLYYRAHANNYDPLDTSGGTAYSVPSTLIGAAGTNQFWDFSTGPTNRVFRFDYLSPTGMTQAADFPSAKIVEQMTDETAGEQQWLFFEEIPGVGRQVYGFYAQNPEFTPSNPFDQPIIDFPDPISYGQKWTTSATYQTTLTVADFSVPAEVTESSDFTADASGTIVLPDQLGTFGQGLRINEEVTINVSADLGDGLQNVDTEYARNYYWLMPGHGIVGQLNSTQASSSPPPPNFTRATAFLRMFETNKKPDTTGGGGCTSPQAVTDLRIRVSNGIILLSWSKAACANSYRIEYTLDPGVSTSWQSLGDPTTGTFWQGENTANGPTRFYRVVSLK